MASPMGSVVHLFLPFRSLTPASPRIPHSLFASFPTPFISDLNDGVVNKILKFADDTKIVSKVASEGQINILQSDLHKMFSWSQDWQRLFNTDKSKVVHFGFNNKEADYILGNHRLNAVEEKRDLGVIVDKSLKS